MALTVAQSQTVFGDRKVVIGVATFTSVTSGNIVTGLANIESFVATNITNNSRAMVIDTTTTAGTAAVSALTANDVVHFIAFGPA